MKRINTSNPYFAKLLNEITPDVLETLTDKQIEALYNYFFARSKANHYIDFRSSIPMPGLRLYLVLLVGPERRSESRLVASRGLYPVFTPYNLLLFMGLFAMICTMVFAILVVTKPALIMPQLLSHPTSIPWINNQDECEKTNKQWKNNKCWDNQHNPDF